MQSLRRAARACLSTFQQQQRSYKNLPVQKNPHVEEWYNAREDMEMTAQISPGMIAQGIFWGFVIPYFTYELIVAEFRASDEQIGRKPLFFPDAVEFEDSEFSGKD